MKELFTIGYVTYTIASFIKTLKDYFIDAVADLRSVPFSQLKPEFNSPNLKEALEQNRIHYVFLGNECGGRSSNIKYYINGQVDYRLLSKDPEFKKGLERIVIGLSKYRIALLCAEADPLQCHRFVLVCRNLKRYGVTIKHILGDGSLEDHKQSELRLLRMLKMDQMNMFVSLSDILEKAYHRQGERVAFKVPDPGTAISGNECTEDAECEQLGIIEE